MYKNPRLKFVGVPTDFFSSEICKKLNAHSPEAVLLYLHLMLEVYQENYELTYDIGFEYAIADRWDMCGSEVRKLVHELIKMDVFDAYMWKKHRILTSAEIQTVYMEAAIKLNRKIVEFDINHLLIPMKKRKEFHLCLKKDNPLIVKMYEVSSYQRFWSEHGSETSMQDAIEENGEAFVAYRNRIDNKGRKAEVKKLKKQQEAPENNSSAE